jgi:signal transduction histidine kinase/ligand-binding sensor domain-containing protein/DNA-binding response OmpR family regulator
MGQGYLFRHITTEDGLPSNYTWHIMKDSRGFMWFTTRAGLCRYDGYEVKVFQYNPADTTSISDIYLKSTIAEDLEGYIWVGSTSGLNKFDPVSEKFTKYDLDPDKKYGLMGNQVCIVYTDRKGVIWIGANVNGLYKYDNINNRFSQFLPSPDRSYSNHIKGVYDDNSGNFWVGTSSGLYQFDPSEGTYNPLFLLDKNKRITNRFTTITEDDVGNIWYCADSIYKYDKINKELIQFEGVSDIFVDDPNPRYMDILIDTLNNNRILWVARSNLYMYDFRTNELNMIREDVSQPENYVGTGPKSLYQDSNGLIWIATSTGISILNPSIYTLRNYNLSSFPYKASSFLKDYEGGIWIGTNTKGLYHYNKKNNLIHHYKPDGHQTDSNPFNGRIVKILEDSKHGIWIVCDRDGVYKLNTQINQFEKFELIKHGQKAFPENLYDIYEDINGTIWIGGPGLFYNNPESDRNYFLLYESLEGFEFNTITDIEEDHEGNLWIGSNAGDVVKIKTIKDSINEFIKYTHNPSDSASLSNRHIWAIYVDDTGSVWIGTNQGLNLYLGEGKGFKRYMMDFKPGLNFIYDITSDRSGNLWMTTELGLIRFSLSGDNMTPHSDNKIRVILPFKEIKTNLYKDNNGRLFIGSGKFSDVNFYSFYLDSINENTQEPKIGITQLRIRNELVKFDSSIILKKNIKLGFKDNFFAFQFAALDYIDPQQNQYAYILEGFDDDWTYSGNRRYANYTGVPPGNYIFRVKASNNNGIWNEAGTSLRVKILPPPWKTWWAYVLYTLSAIGLLVAWRYYSLNRSRLKQHLKMEQLEAKKLKELDKMKSHFFANISHEFRTPLTLIIGPIKNIMAEPHMGKLRQDLSIMLRNAMRLQKLINQLLNLSKIESGKMKLQLKKENIIPMIRGYLQSFESLAKQKNINLHFYSDDEAIHMYADKDKIEKILANLLSNAFKYTGNGGDITLSVYEKVDPGESTTAHPSGECVTLTITDTGIGIDKDKLPYIFDRFFQVSDDYDGGQSGTGIGLALVKELVKAHKGEIQVESEIGKGTTFTITLPKNESLFSKDEFIRIDTESEEDNNKTLTDIEPVDSDYSLIDDKKFTPSDENAHRLLIVEDNRDMRYYIRGFFFNDYQILEAKDGEEGLQLAFEYIPDIIISDVMMPKMSGYEFSRNIKSDERTSHIPIILLTARASKESRMTGLKTGADDFIIKPFDGDELKIRVENLVEQRKKLQNHVRRKIELLETSLSYINTDNIIPSMDEQFLEKTLKVTAEKYSDPEFNVERLSADIGMSRVQLYRKFNALTGNTAVEFIRSYRLDRASELLIKRTGSVAEISYDVGFSSPSYFSECFKNKFGLLPSDYQKKKS